MTTEIWKAVKGYEGLYEVSNLGQVKALERTRAHGRTFKENIKKQSTEGPGYKTVSLTDANGVKKVKKVHRLVAQAFIPNLEGKPQVNHINGDKTDNSAENLEWSTPWENIQHAIQEGLMITSGGYKKGSDNERAKLDDFSVKIMRILYNLDTYSIEKLAKMFDVSYKCAYDAVHKRTWKHVS